MSLPSSTLDSVWARERDRVAASRGEYVSRYTPNLNSHDHDLHTASGESNLDRTVSVATLSLAELTGSRMDVNSIERRTPRKTNPAPYTPVRSWNAAVFNKSASSASVEPSSQAAATTQPCVGTPSPAPITSPTTTAPHSLSAPPVQASATIKSMKPLNPYASVWKPPASLSLVSPDDQTNSLEQQTPSKEPEPVSHGSNKTVERNNADSVSLASQQCWNTQVNKLPEQQFQEGKSWNAQDNRVSQGQQHQHRDIHDHQAFQEQQWDTKAQADRPVGQEQKRASLNEQNINTLRDISHRLQRKKEEPEEALSQRMERIRMNNEVYLKKREIVEAEQANRFENKTVEAATGNGSFEDIDEEIRREREANAARKLRAAQQREWDAGKKW
ncbi:hypothetical protein BX666DRAFT_2110914 [Dichotomocladium elegans]|nr:hypothetical protein BX666DRAFT_2110914 [Dichotomocladium elegans]